jgi:hypothetical protein
MRLLDVDPNRNASENVSSRNCAEQRVDEDEKKTNHHLLIGLANFQLISFEQFFLLFGIGFSQIIARMFVKIVEHVAQILRFHDPFMHEKKHVGILTLINNMPIDF